MDPITLIVTALAAGAGAGALDALKDDVKEAAKAAYERLRGLVKHRFQGNARAEGVLAEHDDDPEAYAVPLAKKLTEAGASGDADLVAAAQAFMDLIDQTGAAAGKYNVSVSNSRGVQIGDHGHQSNTFN